MLCIGNPDSFQELRRWLLVLILAVVASGWRPRYTALLHLWATYSIAVAITLPDGGEAIAVIVCGLITPLAFADDRTWHWQQPSRPLSDEWSALALVFTIALRLQLVYIYLDTTFAKFGNTAWVEGSAMYYISRDSAFGDGGLFHVLNLEVTRTALGTILLSWGALVIEALIAFLLLFSARWRKVALVLDVVLHVGIGLTLGLWSFAVVMISSATIAANPDRAACGRAVENPASEPPDAPSTPDSERTEHDSEVSPA